MQLLPYATLEQADARSAELWQHAKREGWREGNVTTHLYGLRVRTGDPEADADLPAEGDAFMVVTEADDRLDGLVLEAHLTDDEMLALVSVYPAWQTGGTFAVDDLRAHAGQLYRCVQAHTNYDAGHTPDTTPNLWVRVTPGDVIPAWVQPLGAHDAYPLGAQVTHLGRLWESLYDANVWEPSVFGWRDLGPIP